MACNQCLCLDFLKVFKSIEWFDSRYIAFKSSVGVSNNALKNAFAQVAIVSLTTIVAIRKFSYKIKCLTFSIPIMYLLFLLYNQPFVYIFVNTNEKSVFLDYTPAMPSWKASIFITVQYGIVMLITTLITCRKKGADND